MTPMPYSISTGESGQWWITPIELNSGVKFFVKGSKGREASWVDVSGEVPSQLLALNPNSRGAELWGVEGSQFRVGGRGRVCLAGAAYHQSPFALSFSTRAGQAGQRLGRQLLGSRAGAAAATWGARRLRGPAGEARRPPLSVPPPRAGSAGSGRHRAAGAGHCAPGGAA